MDSGPAIPPSGEAGERSPPRMNVTAVAAAQVSARHQARRRRRAGGEGTWQRRRVRRYGLRPGDSAVGRGTTEHLDTVLGVGFGGVDADARGHRRGDRKLGAIRGTHRFRGPGADTNARRAPRCSRYHRAPGYSPWRWLWRRRCRCSRPPPRRSKVGCHRVRPRSRHGRKDCSGCGCRWWHLWRAAEAAGAATPKASSHLRNVLAFPGIIDGIIASVRPRSRHGRKDCSGCGCRWWHLWRAAEAAGAATPPTWPALCTYEDLIRRDTALRSVTIGGSAAEDDHIGAEAVTGLGIESAVVPQRPAPPPTWPALCTYEDLIRRDTALRSVTIGGSAAEDERDPVLVAWSVAEIGKGTFSSMALATIVALYAFIVGGLWIITTQHVNNYATAWSAYERDPVLVAWSVAEIGKGTFSSMALATIVALYAFKILKRQASDVFPALDPPLRRMSLPSGIPAIAARLLWRQRKPEQISIPMSAVQHSAAKILKRQASDVFPALDPPLRRMSLPSGIPAIAARQPNAVSLRAGCRVVSMLSQ